MIVRWLWGSVDLQGKWRHNPNLAMTEEQQYLDNVRNDQLPRGGKSMEQTDIDNRFMYHPPKERQQEKYLTIRAVAKTLAELINEVCPESREKSLAITALEESVMWANASIARH